MIAMALEQCNGFGAFPQPDGKADHCRMTARGHGTDAGNAGVTREVEGLPSGAITGSVYDMTCQWPTGCLASVLTGTKKPGRRNAFARL